MLTGNAAANMTGNEDDLNTNKCRWKVANLRLSCLRDTHMNLFAFFGPGSCACGARADELTWDSARRRQLPARGTRQGGRRTACATTRLRESNANRTGNQPMESEQQELWTGDTLATPARAQLSQNKTMLVVCKRLEQGQNS